MSSRFKKRRAGIHSCGVGTESLKTTSLGDHKSLRACNPGLFGRQARLSRLENEVLGTEAGLKTLEDSLMRSNDALMEKRRSSV